MGEIRILPDMGIVASRERCRSIHRKKKLIMMNRKAHKPVVNMANGAICLPEVN
jgi:hypothetical protein